MKTRSKKRKRVANSFRHAPKVPASKPGNEKLKNTGLGVLDELKGTFRRSSYVLARNLEKIGKRLQETAEREARRYH